MKLQWEDLVNRSTVTLAALVLMLGILLAARAFIPQQAMPVTQQVKSDLSDQETVLQETSVADFFVDFRKQREQARTEEIAMLEEIIERVSAPEESVKEADARKIELTRVMEQERMLEKLLVAKGFEDAAAFILDKSLTVAVKKAELSREDTAKIMELALRCTGLEADRIKIVPVSVE